MRSMQQSPPERKKAILASSQATLQAVLEKVSGKKLAYSPNMGFGILNSRYGSAFERSAFSRYVECPRWGFNLGEGEYSNSSLDAAAACFRIDPGVLRQLISNLKLVGNKKDDAVRLSILGAAARMAFSLGADYLRDYHAKFLNMKPDFLRTFADELIAQLSNSTSIRKEVVEGLLLSDFKLLSLTDWSKEGKVFPVAQEQKPEERKQEGETGYEKVLGAYAQILDTEYSHVLEMVDREEKKAFMKEISYAYKEFYKTREREHIKKMADALDAPIALLRAEDCSSMLMRTLIGRLGAERVAETVVKVETCRNQLAELAGESRRESGKHPMENGKFVALARDVVRNRASRIEESLASLRKKAEKAETEVKRLEEELKKERARYADFPEVMPKFSDEEKQIKGLSQHAAEVRAWCTKDEGRLAEVLAELRSLEEKLRSLEGS